jgi:hypothetical protein
MGVSVGGAARTGSEHPSDEEDSDHEGANSRSQGECGGEQPDDDGPDRGPVAHPSAWSTIRAVNGAWPGGVTENDNPHGPTMIRAGAERA